MIMPLRRRQKGKEKKTWLFLHTSPFTCFLLSFVSVAEMPDSICPKLVDISPRQWIRMVIKEERTGIQE